MSGASRLAGQARPWRREREWAGCGRPAALAVVRAIPRNQLGKPCKPTIKQMLQDAHGDVLGRTCRECYDLLDESPVPYVTDALMTPAA